MKGFLEFLMLLMISKNNVSGQDIRMDIERRKGFKPSPGTIYPVLKELQRKNFIKEIKSGGKEKKYSITPKGKIELEKSKKIFVSLFKGLCSTH